MNNCFSQNKNGYIFVYLQGIVYKSLFLTTGMYNTHFQDIAECHVIGILDASKSGGEKKTGSFSLHSRFPSLKGQIYQALFDVVYVEYLLTDNMMKDGTPVVKVLDFKKAFDPLLKPITGISEFRGAKFEGARNPSAEI